MGAERRGWSGQQHGPFYGPNIKEIASRELRLGGTRFVLARGLLGEPAGSRVPTRASALVRLPDPRCTHAGEVSPHGSSIASFGGARQGLDKKSRNQPHAK
jgi:hypothetical protein